MQFHVWLHPPQGFVRLGGHQLIQAGAAGEAVFKGHNIPGAADEAAARRHIGDVYLGDNRSSFAIISAGVNPNTSFTASARQSSAQIVPVLKVSTSTITGWAAPIA